MDVWVDLEWKTISGRRRKNSEGSKALSCSRAHRSACRGFRTLAEDGLITEAGAVARVSAFLSVPWAPLSQGSERSVR